MAGFIAQHVCDTTSGAIDLFNLDGKFDHYPVDSGWKLVVLWP